MAYKSATGSPSNAPPYDHLLKLLVIGDSGVGKSCLLTRFIDDSFSPSFITTIGIDFKCKNVQVDNKTAKLQIWDTAGQERFRTITTAYYRGAMGILLVYDITDQHSFENIRKWVKLIEENAPENVCKVLVGNKLDMNSKRVISTQQGQQLAHEFQMSFFETSAKTAVNVESTFTHLASEIIKKKSIQDALNASKYGAPGQNAVRFGPRGNQPQQPGWRNRCCATA